MNSKMKELALEEKEIEVQRTNVELKKKSLEATTYQKMVEDIESITEAEDLNNMDIIKSQLTTIQTTTVPDRIPGDVVKTASQNFYHAERRPAVMKVAMPNRCSAVKHQPYVDSSFKLKFDKPKPRLNFSMENGTKTSKPTSFKGLTDAIQQPPVYHFAPPQGCAVMPSTWELPKRLLDEVGICFSGSDAAEYPAYRHRLLSSYRELRYARPDMLLRWIESTIEGQAKRYIRDAFAIMDSGEACDVICNTLEEVYGRADIILEHAIYQVKRQSRSITHHRQMLLELRADMRNLKGVALSIDQAPTLDKPALLGQLYSAFNEKLRNRFESQHPAGTWTFEQFLEFLTNEISYIDSLQVMQVDMKDSPQNRTETIKQKPRFTASRLTSKPFVAAIEGSQDLCAKTTFENAKTCLLHPETASHNFYSVVCSLA